MATGQTGRRRPRGNIETLRSGALRVRVYAGIDPLTRRAHYITETIPPGRTAARDAEKARTRLLNQVDERKAPRTAATLNQLLDRHFDVGLDVDPSTKRDYISKARKHIRPFIGSEPISRLGPEVLESLYADLRRCRDHCRGKRYVQHRTGREHQCDEHGSAGPCTTYDEACRACRRMCRPHQCRPFADSGIRTIHFILSGALASAVRWGWLGVNPAVTARKPALPAAKPKPPTVEEAARLINEAWTRDADWGTFVWTATTTGARRGELCGLRWHHLDLDAGVAHIERAIGKDEDGRWIEKDTKSHQQRRVVLDPETKILLIAQRARGELAATQLGIPFNPRGYVFSLAPDHSTYLIPDSATQRYDRLAERLGINTTLHKLRAYAATELLNGGVDVRAVAGRLGHGSGGAMTLRAYAAWLAEADQRAAPILAGRMPGLPAAIDASPTASGPVAAAAQDEAPPAGPYQRIARDLEGAVAAGLLTSGDRLPTIKDLAARYGVAVATAQRAIAKLQAMGLVDVSRGRRAVVR